MFHSLPPDGYDVELKSTVPLLFRNDIVSVELCPLLFLMSHVLVWVEIVDGSLIFLMLCLDVKMFNCNLSFVE